jgi:hypothetical protein
LALAFATVAAAVDGESGVLAAGGAPAAGLVWARANRERPNTMATMKRADFLVTNFLIIGSFELLQILSEMLEASSSLGSTKLIATRA